MKLLQLYYDEEAAMNVASDITASLEALEVHEVDVLSIQSEILNISHDMLLLYAGTSDIEVDPIIIKLQRYFDCLKAVLDPIVQKSSDEIEKCVDILSGHSARVDALKNAISNVDCRLKFGDMSEYFHHITKPNHAERECLYLLTQFGIHLSEINTETTEHCNSSVRKNLQCRTLQNS